MSRDLTGRLSADRAVRPAGVWEATLGCDILVFALTVRRAYIERHTSPLYSGSLINSMATDGSMYFGIIVLATLANLLTFYASLGRRRTSNCHCCRFHFNDFASAAWRRPPFGVPILVHNEVILTSPRFFLLYASDSIPTQPVRDSALSTGLNLHEAGAVRNDTVEPNTKDQGSIRFAVIPTTARTVRTVDGGS
ncbi:hypothetical protein B0H19DRAFT_1386577 [Mycena capillaripes]|nr:hypothetical protein B0H19DRAFT_1386577 [Mycena capillaripes]